VRIFLRSVGAGLSAWPSRNWTLSTSRMLAGLAPVWLSAAMIATAVFQTAKITEPYRYAFGSLWILITA
jgi:hypothetical protein